MAQKSKKVQPKDMTDDLVLFENCYLPPGYRIFADDIKNFEVFDSDIWTITFPRSGTTWASEMLWMIANDCDLERAKAPQTTRYRFIDLGFLYYNFEHPEKKNFEEIMDPINFAKNQSEPRIFKTHLPFHLLPKQIQSGEKKPKIVYVYRNPMDVCVSYYHHMASIEYDGDFKQYCDLFLEGKVLYGPYWQHVLPFWEIKDQPNLLLLKYEDMKADLAKEIRKTAKFLEKTVSDAQIKILLEYLSFDSMKNNQFIVGGKLMDLTKSEGAIYSPFVRTGIVGSYKKEMDQTYIQKFEKWINENLKETALTF